MLKLSDLSWTGRRWEIRTPDGYISLDKVLEELDDYRAIGMAPQNLAAKELELQALRNIVNSGKE